MTEMHGLYELHSPSLAFPVNRLTVATTGRGVVHMLPESWSMEREVYTCYARRPDFFF